MAVIARQVIGAAVEVEADAFTHAERTAASEQLLLETILKLFRGPVGGPLSSETFVMGS